MASSTASSPSRHDPVAFIEKVLGLDLRQFQREWLTELFREEDGVRTYTRALWGLPRGNGKSHIAAAVAGYMLLSDRPRDNRPPQVVIAAGSWQQGMITFKRLREFIEGSDLKNAVSVLSGRGFMRIKGGAELFVVSADGPLVHGLEPTLTVFDEVWNQKKRELYEGLLGGMIKRPEAIMVCISSAGYDANSLLWQMCKEGEEASNPRFFYQWHAAPEEAPYDDPETWKLANPAMACERPFLARRGLDDNLTAMHESEFRRWHLGQWTAAEESWIDAPSWDGCAGKPAIPKHARQVAICIDASLYHDSTAVATVWCDSQAVFHVEWEVWQPTPDNPIDLPMVTDFVRKEAARYPGATVIFDKQFFIGEAQRLESEGLRVMEWPQDNARMVPATLNLHQAVMHRRLRHGGHAIARQHALAAGVKKTERGVRLWKGASRDRIDCTVALAMGVEWLSRQSEPKTSVYESRGLVTA